MAHMLLRCCCNWAQGEEWLQDFDRTCYSHPGPFDGRSAVEVLASMTALGDVNYSFPQNVYLKVLSQPDRCGIGVLVASYGTRKRPTYVQARPPAWLCPSLVAVHPA